MMAIYDNEKWTEMLTGESLLLAVLGKILYTAPNRDWLESLVQSDLFVEPPFGENHPLVKQGFEMMQNWCAQNSDRLSKEEYTALQDDFLRLFIGLDTVLAPVWESVYFNEDHLVFQQQTFEVRNWYRRYGAEIENFRKEPDDHIGLELIFVAYLAQRALEDLNNQDESSFEENITAQRQFMDEHLLRFAPAWYDLVEEHAKTTFYQAIGYIIRGALQSAEEMLKADIKEGAAA